MVFVLISTKRDNLRAILNSRCIKEKKVELLKC